MLNKISKVENTEYGCTDIIIEETNGNARIIIADWREYKKHNDNVCSTFSYTGDNGNGLAFSKNYKELSEVYEQVNNCVWTDIDDLKTLISILY